MTDITIESVSITFNGAEQHRLRNISNLTFKFLHETILKKHLISSSVLLSEIVVPPIEVSFSLMGDEEIARKSAKAIYDSIEEKLNG